MPRSAPLPLLARSLAALLVVALAGCAVKQPRTDDPWEPFNRRMYAFNDKMDKAVIRPVAVGYRKMTTPNMRRVISNFFANVRMPITIGNDILQGEGKDALKGTGRFIINTTVGFLGFFDPASKLHLPPQETDFGVTLARWGIGEGPYLVLPFIGSTSARDVWRMPVDSWFFDPMSRYARRHDHPYKQQHWPNLAFLVTLRAGGIDAESLLEGTYDPYVFYRDAYRQRRLYLIYDGEPPLEAIQLMQGIDDEDIDALLEQQREYERGRKDRP
ncbi:MAG TPA: VacJ family lipoprotein [Dokdonella sp.]|uniref:MlaA family lipoprotein n=1 Tax=Dokdonella sp. TaxID=2291710 RepID=UPI0025C2D007|nr:VacJ family lipoprotein [Dokdonella sp.]MBX3690745.1 VacJ family lipoprotein [Dokdonella sp.]MCW5568205.1 VacJ family lipoprotein [Dokdonella sp.]HNR91301.1 VacJ family lipoprotein [Dokdonella sp.]